MVAAISLARVAFGYQFQSLASLGPELLQRFGLGYAQLGTLIGLYMAPGILVALPGGLLGRRFGERLVVGGGLLLMLLGSLACALAGGPAGIGAGRALAGSGAVMLIVMQGKMLSDRFAGRSFMPVMGMVVGAFPVGVGLVELTHGPVVRLLGWPGLFIVGAGTAALSLLLFVLGAEPARPTANGSAWALPSRRECELVAVAGVIWTAYNAGYYGFLSYMPSFLAVRGHDPGLLALVLLVATWCNLPATVLGGALAARYGDRPVFLVGTLAGILAVAGPAVLDWPLLWGLLFGTVASLHAGVIVALGHPVGPPGEPGGRYGAVLHHLLCRRRADARLLRTGRRPGRGPGGRAGGRGGAVRHRHPGLHVAPLHAAPPPVIRPMLSGDADAVAALIRLAFSTIPIPLDPAPSALRETPDSIRTHLATGGGALVDGPAGCILWSERDGGLYIGRLCVHPAQQGRGLAALLVGAAETEARRRGLLRLHLGVRLALAGNRRLFARLGFTETRLHAHEGYVGPTWTEAERWLTAPPTGTGTPPG